MLARLFAASVLGVSLSALLAQAQTAADLLQKGIHLQEAEGDADGAIQIYRQVTTAPGVTRSLAAQAQTKIVGALLQKGDLDGAGQEFGNLVHDYADQEELVSLMGERLRATAQNGPTLLLGAFHDGKYRHFWTGVELTIPPDWSLKTQRTDEGDWDRADFADSSSRTSSAFVVMERGVTPSERIADRLQERYQYKISVQRGDSAGYFGYHVRPETFRYRTIGGQQACSAIADYRNAQGGKMSEYMVIVQSEKSLVFFSITAAAADFAGVQARFEPVLLTALVP